jgi:signal transduction histidine kinase
VARLLIEMTRTAGFAALYVVAAFGGRMTVLDGGGVSLVWPAAGVAAVWFAARATTSAPRRRPWRGIDPVVLVAATLAVNIATGASPTLAAALAVANLVQVIVFIRIFGWLCPHLWGGGGREQLSRPADLWRFAIAVVIGTLCGAAIGPTALWLHGGHYTWVGSLVWLTRNIASVIVIGAVGLRLGYLFDSRTWFADAGAGLRRASGWRIAEYVAVMVISAGTYLVGFVFDRGLPLAFPLLTVTVWAALRLNTTFVVMHDLMVSVAAVLFTMDGVGPFAAVRSTTARVLLAQLFVGLVAVLGLALALGRDEHAALLGRLAAAEQTAQTQTRLVTAMVDSMCEGVAVIDAEHRVLLRNPAAGELMGGVPDSPQVETSQVYGLFHPDGTPLADHERPHERALAGRSVSGMDLLVRNAGVPDGRIISVNATPLPAGDGRSHSAVVVFHDVTAERRHRDELASFAGVVAHDLLNPLTIIEGWAEDLADTFNAHAAELTARDAGRSVTRIRRAAARMRNLVNDLLAYTTARDAALVPARVDLHALVADVTAAWGDLAAAAGTPPPRFEVGELDDVCADAVLLRQLLDNLISNAVKYIDPEVVPHITITSAPAGDDWTRIDIADNGTGIPADQREAIFINFHRAHKGPGYTGSGLGLAICKRVVERHGGTITAGDNPTGRGSRFTFTLPSAAGTVLPDRVPVAAGRGATT